MNKLNLLLIAAAFVGCAHESRPYEFALSAPPSNALDLVAKHLDTNGHRVSQVNRKGGSVTTYWEDTHYRWRETGDSPGSYDYETDVYLRYHVSIDNAAKGGKVIVSADVQRCAPVNSVITPTKVIGSCEPMSMLPTHQRVLERLGGDIERLLASR